MPSPEPPSPLRAHLVCGGRFHDFDYARLQLLELLAEHPRIRTTVAADYEDVDTIARSDLMVSYTCDVRPSEAAEAALAEFTRTRKWLALHGSNARFDVGRGGASVPEGWETLTEILGSRFLAHPPIAPYTVSVAEPLHPLVTGVEPFTVTDELYLLEAAPDCQPLLVTHYQGRAEGWEVNDWSAEAERLVAYVRNNVYYMALGHCRSHHDMAPLMDWYPQIERGSWELPIYRELLRRAVKWAMTPVMSESAVDISSTVG